MTGKLDAPIHPGEVLVGEFINGLDITRHRLAVSIGVLPRRFNEIVHEACWDEWEALTVSTFAVFARQGMFGNDERDALIRRRPQTDWIDLNGGSHDGHLDAFDMWIDVLSRWLARQRIDATHDHGR